MTNGSRRVKFSSPLVLVDLFYNPEKFPRLNDSSKKKKIGIQRWRRIIYNVQTVPTGIVPHPTCIHATQSVETRPRSISDPIELNK